MQFNKSITNDNIHFHHIAAIQQLNLAKIGDIVCNILLLHIAISFSIMLLLLLARRHRWRDATDCLITFHSMPFLLFSLLIFTPFEPKHVYGPKMYMGCACTVHFVDFFPHKLLSSIAFFGDVCLCHSATLNRFFPHDVYVCAQWC